MTAALRILMALAVLATTPSSYAKPAVSENQGRLDALDKTGKLLGPCPLKHTDVNVQIAGFIARVTVRQEYQNPFQDKIEAVYTFPLSHKGAVDRMTMVVGERVIEGVVKERQQAQQIYQRARAAGHVASLLDQERPNIFTQSVANIEPGAKVEITIGYSETLAWKDGLFHFAFPMVVGPRYVPGQPAGSVGTGFALPTAQVPDADRVTPMPAPPGMRAGHDISVTVTLDAGLPIRHLESKQHEVSVEYPVADKRRAVVKLKDQATIPNRDFVLEYQTASDTIEDTVLAHTDERGKFFTLLLQPPKRVRTQAIMPRELIFVVDNSGSMMGFPIETAKRAMALCIEGLAERDTFNLITFSGSVSSCFDRPVPNTAENRRKAQQYLGVLRGSGGTEMMNAIRACLGGQDDPERVRVVCFMTDGFVGNDLEILDAVKKNAGTARVFAFGIGTSVNRFLLDGMARAGRGEVHYILNEQLADGTAERFYERVRAPVLTDIQLDFGGLAVTDLYPQHIPDLFSTQPVVIHGRYKHGGEGTITLRGKTGEGPLERKIPVRLPEQKLSNEVLAPLWARAKVDHLMNQELAAIQRQTPSAAVEKEVVGLGLRYRLMTPFTSFVAVEKKRMPKPADLKRVTVPIEMPKGVKREGIFGPGGEPEVALDRFEMGEMPLAPTELTTETLTLTQPAGGPQIGGLGGFQAMGTGGSGAGFGGRGSGRRAAMVGGYGGTKSSERTVAAALNWIARQQEKDGAWSFDGSGNPQSARFANTGKSACKTGATALALLPFLGAGQTHETKGPYQQAIDRGVHYLMQHQDRSGRLGGAGEDATWHAVATLLLCEAHAMTKDRTVGKAAQMAITWIQTTQDTKTGGWGSKPQDPPDLVTTVWHLLALESGRAAGLQVDPAVLTKTAVFLDRFQSEGGAFYGRSGPGKDPAATAAALVCRSDAGWKPDALKRGVEYLAAQGPSKDDVLYNYFATLLAHRASGPAWDAWNRVLRRQLVETQSKDAEAGSWWVRGDSHAAGHGRLFHTVVNALSLEIYYRYLPMHKR